MEEKSPTPSTRSRTPSTRSRREPRHPRRKLTKAKAWLSAILVVQASLAIIVVLAPSAEASTRCFGMRPTIVGTSRADVLEGTRRRDIISGLGGRDTIRGLGGNDVICGFNGADTIIGGSGADLLSGDAGNDSVSGGAGDFDNLWGFSGNDALNGGGGFDWVLYRGAPGPVTLDLSAGSATGEGTDTLSGIEGVVGSSFDDVLTGGDANNTFQAEDGNDTIDGGGGIDFASFALSPAPVTVDLAAGTATGEGTDTLTGIENVFGSGHFGDTLMGDAQDNMLLGSGGEDNLSGSDGNDELDGGDGTDALDGGIGTDKCLNGEAIVNCEA
jgi:Ca2+-binding RTX toxin-like protein